MNNSELPGYLSCAQVRSVDHHAIHQLGMEGLVLMENAARGAVDLLLRQSAVNGVVVVCGKGNNGGDGLAMVRHLLVRNIPAKAVLVASADELRGDALANYQVLNEIDSSAIELLERTTDQIMGQLMEVDGKTCNWLVDALLGTGTKGNVREPFSSLIDLMNLLDNQILAVDIPSGLDGDTGESLGHTVEAELTATFVARKQGFQNPNSNRYTGDVNVLDIGIPERVVLDALRENGLL